MIIDTHCHLYGEDFKDDIKQVIERAQKEGVEKFYLPGIDSDVIPAMLELEKNFEGVCIAMMGLHPCSVNEHVEKELELVQTWLARRRFAAVGEIGLDFYHDISFKEAQFTAFHQQIKWALRYQLPIVIHSRNATRETIDVIKEYAGTGLTGIFHCFSGNEEEAREIIAAGFYLGIGGVVTYKNSGLPAVIEKIGLEQLVLETDAPYLTPVPYRGKRNESSYLTYVVDKLAAITGASKEDIAVITTRNAKKIFGS